jgi:hypothetical protein
MAAPRRDFAVTLLDGRRVVGRYHDPSREWSIYVYRRSPTVRCWATAAPTRCPAH